MAQNITLMGASYSDVPSVTLPKTGGGTASFTDVTDTTAIASDVASGKYFYLSDGTKTQGTASGGGGSVSVTDVANSTGTTCVITTGSSPTPTPTIPLNQQLIDFTKIKSGYVISESTGEESASQWSCCSDYTLVDTSMTFTYIGYQWYNIACYDSSKEYLGYIYMHDDATSISNEYATGTLSSTNMPSGTTYVRISSYPTGVNDTEMSLIRTA